MKRLAITTMALFALTGSSAVANPILLPDLAQEAPDHLQLRRSGARTLLGFGSAISNIGVGPLIVDAQRVPGKAEMVARQIVRTAPNDMATEQVVAANVGTFVYDADHTHWHFRGFDRYELRRTSDYRLMAPDRKTGFCLGDRRPSSLTGSTPDTHHSDDISSDPTFNCHRGDPERTSLREGISYGWSDDYPAYLEGQFIDVTQVPPGRYYLVHRANPDRLLRETNYANNVSSEQILLKWPKGFRNGTNADYSELRTCVGSDRCPLRPRSQRRPRITGVARAGRLLRCDRGAWGYDPGRYEYRWLHGRIVVASSRSYRTRDADARRVLTCSVTASNAAGRVTVKSRGRLVLARHP